MGSFNRDFSVTQIRVSMSGWKCQGMNMNNVCENSSKNNTDKLKDKRKRLEKK